MDQADRTLKAEPIKRPRAPAIMFESATIFMNTI